MWAHHLLFPALCYLSSEFHADPLPHGCSPALPTPTFAHLRNPQGAADVHPLGPTSGGFQGSSSLGAEQALWLDTQGTRPAQPAALWDLEDSVTGLQHPPRKREKEKRFIFPIISINFKKPKQILTDQQNRGTPTSSWLGPSPQQPRVSEICGNSAHLFTTGWLCKLLEDRKVCKQSAWPCCSRHPSTPTY